MKANLLLNCMWYEDITPEKLAGVLEISIETLFKKFFQDEEFTDKEIQKIKDVLHLTFDEVFTIFISEEE